MNLLDEAVAALARAIRIDTQEITRRKAFLEFDETDASLLTELHARLQDVLRRFIPDAQSLERLNQTQATYFDSLTTYRALPKTIVWIPNLAASERSELGNPI